VMFMCSMVNSLAVNSKYCNVFAENKRVVSSTKDFGKYAFGNYLAPNSVFQVAFVAIGATMVGSIPFSKNEGDYAQKGDEVTIHIFKIVAVMVQVNGSDVCQAIGRVVEVKPQNCYHEKIKTCEILLGGRRSYLEEQDVSGPHPLVDSLIVLGNPSTSPWNIREMVASITYGLNIQAGEREKKTQFHFKNTGYSIRHFQNLAENEIVRWL
ncbi:Phosphatidylserine decarboxylase-related, partial [Dillenia turbinata]